MTVHLIAPIHFRADDAAWPLRRIKPVGWVANDPFRCKILPVYHSDQGRQDHTTSPSAAIFPRPRAVDRSQVETRPCDPTARRTLRRPTHPAPNVRDDRETPLLRI
jgi:hypothetical protein